MSSDASSKIVHSSLLIPNSDYHMHTPRCHHAIGSVADYAEAALNVGLSEIGISDHAPMPAGYDEAWRMQISELDGYVAEVQEAAARYAGRLTIRLGLEADFYPGAEDWLRDLAARYPWDYWIGSVHYIGDWGFDNPEFIARFDEGELTSHAVAYYDLVAQSAASGLFDIIGHPDLIKKFGHRPDGSNPNIQQAEEAMLQAVAKAGCALEISSAGLRKPVGEVYPHGRLIVRATALGIPFACGSDAHAPGEVGHAQPQLLAILRQCGATTVATFAKRQRGQLAIKNEKLRINN